MRNLRLTRLAGLALASVLALVRPAVAQVGTAFTYQGRLTDGAIPANGPYDFRFILYDAAVGGSQQGPIVTRDDLAVSAGLFTVSLDFGAGLFAGNRRFLEISVRPGASTGAYTPLAGRQELTPGPHVLYSTTSAWGGLIGVPPGFADGIDNDSGGDITQVTAGTGLAGGGTAGAVTVSANFGGSGSAPTVSRSDHDHFAQQWLGTSSSAGLEVTNSSGIGLRGVSTATTTRPGVYGEALEQTAAGVHGYSTATLGGRGVRGETQGQFGLGVLGVASGVGGSGVYGEALASNGIGVEGQSYGTSGSAAGIYGVASSSFTSGATGVWGVQGPAAGSYAGYFSGRAHVNGTLSKSAGSFKIDHPLDPENKYLYHSFVESPDMLNVYNGNVVLDAAGEGEVTLPEWFQALNQDFRYQLTPIGGPGPGLYVAQEVADNRFRIAGGSPGLKVSWLVTGVRHDAYARKNRVPVEELKPEYERGVYLQPEAHGLPTERGLDHRRQPPPREFPSAPARSE